MRYAFVSDIHANLQAWQAVWADIGAQQVDEVVCLGDVVGYGPRPAETLIDVYAKVDRAVMGNHDAVMFGMLDLELFNDSAQEMIAWTMEQLDADTAMLLAETPYTLDIDCGDFRAIATHASMHPPEAFNYILTEEEARQTWNACDAPLIFIGHTHEPRVDYIAPDGNYSSRYAESLTFQEGYRCVINVGSVGMPRTGDPRACYVIFDTETKELTWLRVEYDVNALLADVHERMGDSGAANQALAVFDSEKDFAPEEDFAPPQIVVSKKTVARARSRAHLKQPSQKRMGKMTVLLVAIAVAVTGLLACGLFYGMMKVSADKQRRKKKGPTRAKIIPPPTPKRKNTNPKKKPEEPKTGPVKEPVKEPVVEPVKRQRKIRVGNKAFNYDSDPQTKTNRIAGYTVPSGGRRKLVLVASWEHNRGTISAKWKGRQKFHQIAKGKGGRFSAILYLDHPTPGTGDIVVTFQGNTRSRVGVIMLTGFDNSFNVKSEGTGTTGRLTTREANTVVIGVYTANEDQGTITSSLSGEIYSGNSGSSHGHAGYHHEADAGRKTYEWEDSNAVENSNALAGFVPLEQ